MGVVATRCVTQAKRVALVICIRDDGPFTDLNVAYHLDCGFDYVFVAGPCLDTDTLARQAWSENPRTVVLERYAHACHDLDVQKGLTSQNSWTYSVDWLLFLDSNEFFFAQDGSVQQFVDRLEASGIFCAMIEAVTAVQDPIPVHPIDSLKFSLPEPEVAGELDHPNPKRIFRDLTASQASHDETGEGPGVDGTPTSAQRYDPLAIQLAEVRLFHFNRMKGTPGPSAQIYLDDTLARWYAAFFRRQIESKAVKSVCLVRVGALGDVLMTEPVARYLKDYVDRVCLATTYSHITTAMDTYDEVYEYEQIGANPIPCDMAIRLRYELGGTDASYIQSYMQVIRFDDVHLTNVPALQDEWPDIVGDRYAFIAPDTSPWLQNKRQWGTEKFVELSNRIRAAYGIRVIFLERKHSFQDMLSLIRHCEFMIGNDSGPAIIAQSFRKKCFIIFGATDPKYLHLSDQNVPIYDPSRHEDCSRSLRHEELMCCSDD